MKWPMELTVIRHDVSAFNAMKKRKESDPKHARLRELYDKRAPTEAERAEMLEIAEYLRQTYGLKVGDWNTPLHDETSPLAQQVGARLSSVIKLPHIVYVSPYERTLNTLEGLRTSWPELRDIKTVEDDRLREQEHGLSLLYNDWRAFQTVYPEQRELRQLEGRYWYRYPQGENVPDVRERVRSFQNTLIREHAGDNVLVVSHHLCLLALRANMERWDAEEFLRVDEEEKPINCGVTVYRGKPELGERGKLVLDKYNLKLYE